MNAKIIFRAVAAAVLGVFVMALALAKEPTDRAGKKRGLRKTTGIPEATILNINNLTTWHKWDGDANHSPGGDDGLIYPRNTGSVIYQDGVMWGAKAFTDAAKTIQAPTQHVRVGGSWYSTGTLAGAIIGSGATAQRELVSDATVKIYRIRRDYKQMGEAELTADAANVNEAGIAAVTDAMRLAVTTEYNNCWVNWPVSKGAPYIERNGQPGYQAPTAFSETFTLDSLISGNYDEPGVAGADPNSPADQVIWTVYNDLSVEQATETVGSEPLGLEVQKTVWGYKRADALGNLYFSRFKLINKGGVDVDPAAGVQLGSFYLDSVFVCQWSDPDLGVAGDDLTGCDTVLSMGFVYNGQASDGEFASFGLPPPAVGYDFLAGPLVPAVGSTAIFDLKPKADHVNLGMSAFSYFSAGSPYTDPNAGGYDSQTGRMWKMLRGFAPLGTLQTADDPYEHGPFEISKFPLSGDPVAGSGMLDGKGTQYSFPPGDRRLLLVTGPFTLAPTDTQEIYVGTVAGLGSDRISSVAMMKFNDEFVQGTFNALFAVPSAPLSPDVKVSEEDGEVMLEWGSNTARVAAIENTVQAAGGFTFEGYNVYQLPAVGSLLSAGKLIANFDVANGVTVIFDRGFDATSGRVYDRPVMFGDDNGILRFFKFDRDYINDIDKLYNGKEYYLVVTAYTRATVAGYLPGVLESQPVVLRVRSKVPYGADLIASGLDTIKTITHTVTSGGLSDGNVYPIVLQPSAVTGHTYRVGFKPGALWYLVDVTTGDTLVNNQSNQTADALNSPVVHGIQWRVIGAPLNAKDFRHVANPSGPIVPATYVGWSTWNSLGFPDPSGQGNPVQDWGGGQWGVQQGGGANATYSTFVSRVFRNDNFDRFIPNDYEMRFTAAGGVAYEFVTTGRILTVPFELWCIGVNTPDDASDDYRMIPWLYDFDGSDSFNLMAVDHNVSGGANDPYTDWVYWMEPNPKTPGTAGYDAFVADTANYDAGGAVTGTGDEVFARMVLVNANGGLVTDPTFPANATSAMPATGNVIRIMSTKPNQTTDLFEINTSTYVPTSTAATEKAGADKIGVYPNPYYAFNAEETSRFQRFVTFNNLPPVAKIRIFNLAGQLVRTLEKDNLDQFLRWNLNNTYNFPIASGVYIVHVEATLPSDNSKVTKILKLAVIQEQEILTTY